MVVVFVDLVGVAVEELYALEAPHLSLVVVSACVSSRIVFKAALLMRLTL